VEKKIEEEKLEKEKRKHFEDNRKKLFWSISFISTFQAGNYPEKREQRYSTKIQVRKLMKFVISKSI
jgi:hypothetical protein